MQITKVYPDNISYAAPFFLLMSVPIRILIKKYNCRIPQETFLFVITALLGICVVFTSFLDQYKYVVSVPPYHFLSIFFPIFIFNTVYSIDQHTFIKTLPVVLFNSTFGVGTLVYSLTIILKSTIHTNWSFSMSILAALTLAPIAPTVVSGKFQELERFKYLASVINSEFIVSFATILIAFEIYLGYHTGIINKWYHFVSIIVRYISISVLIGCITGKITSIILCYLYSEPNSAMCVSVAMTFFTYYLVQFLFNSSGHIAVICMCYHVAIERHKLSVEVDTTISDFWMFLSYMCNIVCFMCLTLAIVTNSCLFFELKNLYTSLILYFSAIILRFVFHIAVGPLINFYSTYNFNLRCMIALSWAGVRGTPNFLLTLMLLREESTYQMAQEFVSEMGLFTFLTLFIATGTMETILELIGLTELSSLRKTNMNNCMIFIMEKRECIINTLKINRYFSDANWKLTREDTIMRHPYKKSIVIESDSEEEGESASNQHILTCPDCNKDVPFQMSEKDYEQLIREARIKILKAKRVSIIKQFENGFIDKKCMQVLILHLDIVIGSNEKGNSMDLQKIMESDPRLGRFYNFLMKHLYKEDCLEPPSYKFPCRRLSFFIVNHVAYNYIINIHIIIIATTHVFAPKLHLLHIYNRIFFIGEVIIKILASSNTTIANGFAKYLSNQLNKFDLVLITVEVLDFCIKLTLVAFNSYRKTYISFICDFIRLYRIYTVLQRFFPKLMQLINRKIDAKVCFGYDLAIAMVNCCDEIKDSLKQTIDLKVIRLVLAKELTDEKSALIKLMEKVQKEKPWISITVKTKQVIRSTLRSMVETLNEMKIQGFVDNTEYTTIFKEIFELTTFLRNLNFVQPSPPKIIFNEVPWMANDDKIIEYLFKNAEKVTLDSGQMVCKNDKFSEGVYIVVTGLLRLKYVPNNSVLGRLHTFGTLPIVDYQSSLNFEVTTQDNIMSGNSIGELSVLTGRPYNCTIVADSVCQAYLLKTEVIKNAMKLNSHPITGLEARMWKCTTINLAVSVLIDLALYQGYTQEQIKFKLEKSFMPNLSCYKMFVITELMDDIILIEGVAADYNSGEIFIAPMAIPKTVQKLILPRSSYLTLDEKVETKLLIVPMGETTGYAIMEAEEEIAQMVSIPSSKCLLHTVQDQHWKKRKLIRKKPVSTVILNVESIISRDSRTSDEKFEILEPGDDRFSLLPSSAPQEPLLLQNRRLLDISEESISDNM